MQLQTEQRDFKDFLLGKLTFPSSIKATNLMKDGKNDDQSVKGSQVLVVKLNEV